MKRGNPCASSPEDPGDRAELLEQMEERLLDRLMARLSDSERKKRRVPEVNDEEAQSAEPMDRHRTVVHQGTTKNQGQHGARRSPGPENPRRFSMSDPAMKDHMYNPTFPVPENPDRSGARSRSRSNSEPVVMHAPPITGDPTQERPKYVNYSWGISVESSQRARSHKWRDYIDDKLGDMSKKSTNEGHARFPVVSPMDPNYCDNPDDFHRQPPEKATLFSRGGFEGASHPHPEAVRLHHELKRSGRTEQDYSYQRKREEWIPPSPPPQLRHSRGKPKGNMMTGNRPAFKGSTAGGPYTSGKKGFWPMDQGKGKPTAIQKGEDKSIEVDPYMATNDPVVFGDLLQPQSEWEPMATRREFDDKGCVALQSRPNLSLDSPGALQHPRIRGDQPKKGGDGGSPPAIMTRDRPILRSKSAAYSPDYPRRQPSMETSTGELPKATPKASHAGVHLRGEDRKIPQHSPPTQRSEETVDGDLDPTIPPK